MFLVSSNASSSYRVQDPVPLVDSVRTLESACAYEHGALDRSPDSRTRMAPAELNALSDRELVDRATGGDKEAFCVWMRRHEPKVFRLIFHIVRRRAEAEELAQEAFVRAYRALGQFDGRSEPFTWLYRIAVNVALNGLRGRKAQAEDIDDPRLSFTAAEGSGSAHEIERRQLYAALATSLDSLSDTLRVTLLLVCVDGVSQQDAARILGIPEGTVAWRVHEARRKLRLLLSEQGFELVVDERGSK